jgi:hypothetical protein
VKLVLPVLSVRLGPPSLWVQPARLVLPDRKVLSEPLDLPAILASPALKVQLVQPVPLVLPVQPAPLVLAILARLDRLALLVRKGLRAQPPTSPI